MKSSPAGASAEPWFYGVVSPLGHPWLPECLAIEGCTVALRWIDGATSLADVPDDHTVLSHLAMLGPVLAELHQIEVGPDAPLAPQPHRLDPLPVQVLNWANPTVTNVLRHLQASPPLVAADRLCANRGSARSVLVHGDVKLDNVLVHRGRRVLLDWDLAGVGEAWRDLSACLGTMAEVWVRALRSDDDAVDEVLPWQAVTAAADALLHGYGISNLDVSEDVLWAGAALWLAWRAVSMASFLGTAAAGSAHIRAATAEWIADELVVAA